MIENLHIFLQMDIDYEGVKLLLEPISVTRKRERCTAKQTRAGAPTGRVDPHKVKVR
jgi:hypothetical protein